jgi:type I restriction enzyme M protein
MLWRAADKLRGSMDAGQYKDFVLSLVFLRSMMTRADWDEIAALASRGADGAGQAEQPGIGRLLDEAMSKCLAASAGPAGAPAAIFSGDSVDQRRLAELVGLVSDARLPGRDGGAGARDVLGEVYEYFLDKFARAEGKRGGEFYTPASVVKVLVEVLEPYAGRVYDPCCGSGGMFTQAEKFVLAHRGKRDAIAVYGQESNERTWRLAQMNLAIHGIPADLGSRWADAFREDKHPELAADYILANPPFNMSDWAREAGDPRWAHGVPPAGNANFAWLQLVIGKLASHGTAGVVLANGSMSSRQSGEGRIRAAIIEAGLVSCMVALPPQLFRTTQIPACLWFLAAGKGARRGGALHERGAEILFIDARAMGTMVDRTERVLADDDIARIAHTYHAWRGTASATAAGLAYTDVPGFCYSATHDEVRDCEYILTPGRYVGAPEPAAGEAEPAAEKVERLKKELYARLEESARLAEAVRDALEQAGG